MNVREQKGQTVLEYLLVIILLSAVIFFAVQIGAMKEGVEDAGTNIGEDFTNFKFAPPGGS